MNNQTPLTISPNQSDLEIIAKRKEAWGKLAESVYTTDLRLQAMSQKAISSLVYPKTIQDIPAAEDQLKSLSATENKVIEERKAITNVFRDVADTMMKSEKSFTEPKKKYTDAIISLKKLKEAEDRKTENINNEKRLIREQVIKHCADLDARIKTYMNELISKAFVFALKQSIPIAFIGEKIKEWSDGGIQKVLEFKCEPFNRTAIYISKEESEVIVRESHTINLIDYANQYDFLLRDKFKDYEVAFKNKEAAIQKNEADRLEAEKAIAGEKLNTEISASIEANIVLDATPTIDTKALKKSYEVDMPETVDNALMLFSAFAANKEKCMAELRVNKWFSFNASQIAGALSKIKSKDNLFQPSGINFKEVAKL